MAFHNIPPNGFPDIPDMEELEAVVKDVAIVKNSVSGLATDVSNLSDNKTNQITIAPFFDPETAYEVGDLVYYNGLSYRCTNDHEGEWDAADFSATTIDNELGSLRSGLNSKLPFRPITSGSLHDIKESGMYYLTGAVSDRPAGLGGVYIVYAYNQDLLVGLYIGYAIDHGNHQIAIVSYYDNNWSITDIESTTRN